MQGELLHIEGAIPKLFRGFTPTMLASHTWAVLVWETDLFLFFEEEIFSPKLKIHLLSRSIVCLCVSGGKLYTAGNRYDSQGYLV